MIENKKASIILILKVLEEYSDENHYLTHQEIIDKVYQLYNISLERKSVASSLALLEELDYDINKGPKGGFALLSRTFDNTEAFYLNDALFSSRSLSAKQAYNISNSISKCFSKYQRKDYSYIHKTTEVNRTSNNEVLFNVSIINEAIKRNKRISFQYLTYDKNGKKITRKDGYEYTVSPYYLINNFGRYYLLCNYNSHYSDINFYRIDYMVNIKIREDKDIKSLASLDKKYEHFDISKYINDHIYMFGGDVIDAKLELSDEKAILYVKDWFGENCKISIEDDIIFANVKCNEQSLYFWIMQYSNYVKVISPESLVKRIVQGLEESIKKYKK